MVWINSVEMGLMEGEVGELGEVRLLRILIIRLRS